jgi:hypothetical protein
MINMALLVNITKTRGQLTLLMEVNLSKGNGGVKISALILLQDMELLSTKV